MKIQGACLLCIPNPQWDDIKEPRNWICGLSGCMFCLSYICDAVYGIDFLTNVVSSYLESLPKTVKFQGPLK